MLLGARASNLGPGVALCPNHREKVIYGRTELANERMSKSQLETAREILTEVRQRIEEATQSDERFNFLLRRYVSKNLSYDERGDPQERTRIKLEKLLEQKGKCAYAKCPTPNHVMTKEDEPELDRLEAIKGYTPENTVLVHHACHRMSQKEKGFA
jgi:hypothetical protein